MNTTIAGNGTEETKPNGKRPEAGERDQVLADWAASRRTVEEMAAATGWSKHTLYRWRREAEIERTSERRPAAKVAGLVAVPKPAMVAAGNWAAEIAIGPMGLRLAAGCPVGWVAELVRELRPC